MATYAIVQGGEVINVVAWDGNETTWQPPEGTTAVEVTAATGPAYFGGAYSNGVFSASEQQITPAK